jgi:hypothetical protein
MVGPRQPDFLALHRVASHSVVTAPSQTAAVVDRTIVNLQRGQVEPASQEVRCPPPPADETYWRGRRPPTLQSDGSHSMRYALLWLLGVPIPVLILIYFLFH